MHVLQREGTSEFLLGERPEPTRSSTTPPSLDMASTELVMSSPVIARKSSELTWPWPNSVVGPIRNSIGAGQSKAHDAVIPSLI
jgi:hypothetical protein